MGSQAQMDMADRRHSAYHLGCGRIADIGDILWLMMDLPSL